MHKIAHWTETYSSGESIDLLRDLAFGHALRGGQQGKRILTLVSKCKFRELCDFKLDYEQEGLTANELYHARQALAFFTKLEFLEVGVDKEAVAASKFSEAEDACEQTNEIFKLWAQGKFCFSRDVEAFLYKAQRKIAQVLGPVPSWEQLGYRFGKGATTRTRKRLASIREKFAAGPSCSEELLPAANAVLGELPKLTEAWSSCFTSSSTESSDSIETELIASVPVLIEDGVLNFVPKNALTYRTTITEPVLNGLVQLALGDAMFELLARSGLDLRDQSRNQSLALEGSLTGDLATLDLSSASDTVSKELVYSLLPLDWACLLSKARTGHVLYNGRRYTLEKFSSMGNGFTFPLESLIFWALTCAVCGDNDNVSVYGDDIICPSAHAATVARLLACVGFTVNEKKSYFRGPFRESCGRDYFRGIDIRPFYQKELVSPRTLFMLHNFYVRRGEYEDAIRVLNLIHPCLRIYGPDGYGDGHLLSSDHERARKPRHTARGYSGYTFRTFTVKGRRDLRPSLPGDFVLPSYSIYRRTAEELLDVTNLRRHTDDRRVEWHVFLARFARGIGSLAATLPIPDEFREGSSFKGVPFPLAEDNAYKCISIYTFG